MGAVVSTSRQHRLPLPGCPGCWPGCCASDPWQHPRTCPWISCRCCLVDCTDCPRWSACSPCGQEASCCPSLLAIFPDSSLDLRLLGSGGQTSSFGLNSRLIM